MLDGQRGQPIAGLGCWHRIPPLLGGAIPQGPSTSAPTRGSISTPTEQPIGATIGVVGLAVISQILDSISQLSAIHPYLPTHYWLSFGDLLRDPIATDQIVPGMVSALVYTVIFLAAAWARFGGKDITS